MWKPILDFNKDLFDCKISEIAANIEINFTNEGKLGLISGKIGIVIFCFYYYKYSSFKRFEDIGIELLDNVLNNLDEVNSFSFSEGFSGIIWGIQHLIDNDFIDLDLKELFLKLNKPLKQNMIFEVNRNNYDYLHGAMGNGLYFVNSLQNKYSIDALNELVQEIFRISIKDVESQGLKWSSVINNELNIDGYNLGLSHGVASIIAFLTKLIEKDLNNDLVYKMVEGATNYLIKIQNEDKNSLSLFPNWILENADKDNNSRLAWCYGDLGISIALWRASKILKNINVENIAVNILKHSTQRKDLKVNFVFDSMLCHGTSGIAHIYNRMYHYTEIKIFKDAAIFWYSKTLEMATHEDGFAGYKYWSTTKFGRQQKQISFLEGIAGIGLALISAVSDIEPRWDECLLLS